MRGRGRGGACLFFARVGIAFGGVLGVGRARVGFRFFICVGYVTYVRTYMYVCMCVCVEGGCIFEGVAL